MHRIMFDENGYRDSHYRHDPSNAACFISCDALVVGDYGGFGVYGEANIRALENEEGAQIEHGSHGYKQLWLPDTEDNQRIITNLEDRYPLVDESILSELEIEWEQEAWDSYGRHDLRRAIQAVPFVSADGVTSEHVADWFDDLPDDEARNVYASAMERADYPEIIYEYSGACLPLKEIAADAIDIMMERYDPKTGRLRVH